MNNNLNAESDDELRPEYDSVLLKQVLQQGVRGKCVERCRQGSNVVKLAPDVAAAFPTEDSVNEALRGLLKSTGVAA